MHIIHPLGELESPVWLLWWVGLRDGCHVKCREARDHVELPKNSSELRKQAFTPVDIATFLLLLKEEIVLKIFLNMKKQRGVGHIFSQSFCSLTHIMKI